MITVRNISIYKEAIVEDNGVIVPLGLMDTTEATALACELMSAAEDLLPDCYEVERRNFAAAREAIELDQENREG